MKDDIKAKLIHAVTQFDIKDYRKNQQNPKHHYNPNALGLYLGRLEDLHKDLDSGVSPGVAINNHFNGGLARHLHKTLKTGGTDLDSERRKLYDE